MGLWHRGYPVPGWNLLIISLRLTREDFAYLDLVVRQTFLTEFIRMSAMMAAWYDHAAKRQQPPLPTNLQTREYAHCVQCVNRRLRY